mmetsp:Transcript_736/g.1173  ORF Transcript_736/g.1173 Transcript_736/m.1173 type:complete len:217 (+) Transcript_736:1758-2408(+)
MAIVHTAEEIEKITKAIVPLSSMTEVQKIARGLIPITCAKFHDGSCLSFWLKNFWHGFKFGMKFYLPLTVIPLLLRYRAILKRPFKTIGGAVKACIRSTMVLAVMVLIGKIGVCAYTKATGKFSLPVVYFVSLAVTPAAFIESPAKISEMALYVMPRFFDSLWKFLKRRNLVSSIPGGQVILFCMATAAIMYSHQMEPDNIKPMYRKVCDKFFGEN